MTKTFIAIENFSGVTNFDTLSYDVNLSGFTNTSDLNLTSLSATTLYTTTQIKTNLTGTTERVMTVDQSGSTNTSYDVIDYFISNDSLITELTTNTNWTTANTYIGTSGNSIYNAQYYRDMNYIYEKHNDIIYRDKINKSLSDLNNVVWSDVLTTTINSATQFQFTASTATQTNIIAYSLCNKLLTWYSGATQKYGWVIDALTGATNLVIVNVNGDSLTDATNVRYTNISTVQKHEINVAGTIISDTGETVGAWFWNQNGQNVKFLSASARVLVGASGSTPDLQYNIYDDGVAMFTVDPTFGSGTTVLNSVFDNKSVASDSIVGLKITVSTGDVNQAQDMKVICYYTCENIFKAL